MCLDADWDVFQAIISRLRPLSAYTLEHVKGHQDDKISFDLLPRLAQLNVICDQNSKEALEKEIWNQDVLNQATPHPLSFPTIKLHNKIIRDKCIDNRSQ